MSYFESEDSGQYPDVKFLEDPLQYCSSIYVLFLKYPILMRCVFVCVVCVGVCICVRVRARACVCVCVRARALSLFLPCRKVIRHNFSVNCKVYKLTTSAETVCTRVLIV